MFQTEPILFLQSFSNKLLDSIFLTITGLGNGDTVQFFVIAAIFGVHFRKGFILLHVVIWTAFATSGLKDVFAMPRPFYVDSAVRAIGSHVVNPTPLKAMGADTFWGLPDPGALEYVRTHRMGSFGFPSGHTSGAVALWGGMICLFRNKWLTLAGGLLMALIPFSRMYLGRHFFADLLGGYLLGGFSLLVLCHTLAGRTFTDFMLSRLDRVASNIETIFLFAYFFGLPLMVMMIFRSHSTYPALLLGLNSGYFLVRAKGLPEESGSVFIRMVRVGIAVLVFRMTDYVYDLVLASAFSRPPAFISFAGPALMMACCAWAATEANIFLGLMKREK